MTIIDRGLVRFSGPMNNLLEQDSELPVYRLEISEERASIETRLRELEEVDNVERIDDSLEYRVTGASQEISANRLLAALLPLDIPLVSFRKDLRHLNEAFMDLTTEGVR